MNLATLEKNKSLGNLIEQKILEFFSDPDAGLSLKKPFAAKLQERMSKKQKLTSLSTVAKKYGAR